MNEMAGNVPFAFLKLVVTVLVLVSACIVVHAQDTSNFISIDCGSAASYIDSTTGISYVPDSGYIDSGVNEVISTQYKTNGLEKHFLNVRSFPDGDRNCYTLKPNQVAGTKYLIRARFLYGNYDSLNDPPRFDLYIGANLWTTVSFSEIDEIVSAEIALHSPSTIVHLCLVNKGKGTPFISVLELRLINTAMYNATHDSLTNWLRYDLGSTYDYRYSDDVYDRIWEGVTWFWSYTMKPISTTQTVENTLSSFAQPSIVMQTALTPKDPDLPLSFGWESYTSTEYYIYWHFAEIEALTKADLRQFIIYLNGKQYSDPVTPLYLSSFCVYNSREPLTGKSWYNFTIEKTNISTHPPILNAIDIYYVNDMSALDTDSNDVEAVYNIKSAYNVNRKWQGDPCMPTWSGLNCSFPPYKAPRIISLDLSSANLGGEITPYIYNLALLQKLDLSNNNLVGTVPEFLSKMTSLTYINLKGNKLGGILPADLVAKSKQGSLTLIVDPNLCLSGPCNSTSSAPPSGGKKSNLLIPVIASIVGIIILVVVVLIIVLCMVKNRSPKGAAANSLQTREVNEQMPRSEVSVTEPVSVLMPAQNERIQTKNQCFAVSELDSMTNNFSKVIGYGSFGTVYLGVKDGVKVAVKILSASSTQGYKEFKAEAELLMTVHHRNLTSLIGYCNEGNTLGLIYEFMANGNLGSHISDKSLEYLTWEDRLHIALDSAQGLEYLHNGCRNPIVHRDIKPANILLNEKFEAKIADFGLSRAFPADTSQSGFVPTVVAGTPGYLDPEYYQTQQLNEKSDVFSFGVVLLEMITSRPVMGSPPQRLHIGFWVTQVLSSQGDIKANIDPRLRGDYDTNSAWKAVEVALTCVKQTSDKRPSMNQVVSELSQCLNMEKARQKEGFTTDTIDSVEMASLGLNNSYMPSARLQKVSNEGKYISLGSSYPPACSFNWNKVVLTEPGRPVGQAPRPQPRQASTFLMASPPSTSKQINAIKTSKVLMGPPPAREK